MGGLSIEERIGRTYAGLSDKLRIAADYVADHPVEIATRSLRAVATDSGVSPATLSRLARALGYDDFAQMRDDGRAAMGRRLIPFSERAQTLRETQTIKTSQAMLTAHVEACTANLSYMCRDLDAAKLGSAVEALHRAKTVMLVGSLGSSGFVDYFGYLAHWFRENWIVAGRNGTILSAAMSRLGPDDAVFVLSKTPHARRSILALQSAHERGIPTVFVTDSYASPACAHADYVFAVPTESPQFFSSYAATLVLIEAMVSQLLARAGSDAEDMIRGAEKQIHGLGETWEP
ncbi:MAG: MurR/RpiR family transcriptional regulator [Pseudomonadota bacterium]